MGNMRQRVLALKVKCPNRDKGLPFSPPSSCPYVVLISAGCAWTGTLRQYLQQQHETTCLDELIYPCSNGCGAVLAGRQHQQHHERECPKERVRCAVAGCEVQVERAAMPQHMSEAAASGQHLLLLQNQLVQQSIEMKEMKQKYEAELKHMQERLSGNHCLDWSAFSEYFLSVGLTKLHVFFSVRCWRRKRSFYGILSILPCRKQCAMYESVCLNFFL